jgi:hypothetical protein
MCCGALPNQPAPVQRPAIDCRRAKWQAAKEIGKIGRGFMTLGAIFGLMFWL